MSTQLHNRILVNSLPKSGTHLLTQAMEIFGYQEYATHLSSAQKIINSLGWGRPRFLNYREAKRSRKQSATSSDNSVGIRIGAFTPYYVNQPTIRDWLNHIPIGQYIQGHLPWTAALPSLLADLNYRHLVIIRDPRAVVASFIPFVLTAYQTDMGPHFLEHDFKARSFKQQLQFVLQGGHAPKAGVEVQPFTEVYRSLLAWQHQPGALLVHFEELVGIQGGGDAIQQERAVKQIAKHLEIPFDEAIAARVNQIYNPTARTFRIGKIDSWKNSMAADDLAYLNQSCEPLCQEAGYLV